MLPKGIDQHSYTLYVGDLESSIQDQQLYNVFVQFGPLYSVRIMKNSETKLSRGFGFVSFYNQNDAQRAKDSLNHFRILTIPIRVLWKRNPQDIQAQNNLFVKNLPLNLLPQELENQFSRFGPIFSCKISYDSTGKSRGYGYVNFESKENAQQCLKSNDIVINNQKVEVLEFIQYSARGEKIENNLYTKNFPFMSIQELEKKLEALCSQFGQVTSVLAKKDAQQRLFAFVCFKEKADAKKAFDTLPSLDPFEKGTFIYVNWAQKKRERVDYLQRQFKNHVNETNLYTKNLKPGVTVADLKDAFKQFGEIKSGVIKTPSNPAISTKFGFMDFSSKLEAQKVLIGGPTNPLVKSLYDQERVYINIFMPRNLFETYKRNRTQQINQYQLAHKPPMQVNEMNQMQMFQQLLQVMQGGQGQLSLMGHPLRHVPPMMNQTNMMHQGFQATRIPSGPSSNYLQQNPQMYQRQFHRQNYKRPISKTEQKPDYKKLFQNLEYLNKNVQEFKSLDQELKRSIFGELLYPKIKQHSTDIERTARMLIDFEVFEEEDILELANNAKLLEERIQEANQLIDQEHS